jgi:hypothetical protein
VRRKTVRSDLPCLFEGAGSLGIAAGVEGSLAPLE